MRRRLFTLTSAALVVTGIASCANTDSWVDSKAAPGWSAQYADAANSSFTSTDGAQSLKLQWTRSVKGALASGAALSSSGYLAVNGETAGGCSLMVWENANNGRQRWCTRMVLGGDFASPLFDGFDNLYVGQPGMMLSYPPTQWIRWRQNVIGMPTTPRFLGAGQLLVTTHLGQVLVFDSHRGVVVGTPIDLVEGIDPTDSARGLDDCAQNLAGCPVAAAPAFSPETNTIVVGVWQPGAKASTLTALRYHPGQAAMITKEWTSEAISSGVIGSPVLSADGETVYINGRDQRLWALNAADGHAKWYVELHFQPQTPPSVTPGGMIIAGGGPDTKLVGIQDSGNRAEILWSRDDVTPLTTSAQAGPHAAYTVAEAPSAMDLLAFDPANGKTLNTYSLPQAEGYPAGISVGIDRRVVITTSAGQVYSFAAQ